MSRRALFRREALDFQLQHKQWGHVALLQPPSAKVLTWLSVVAVVFVLAFVCFTRVRRRLPAISSQARGQQKSSSRKEVS